MASVPNMRLNPAPNGKGQASGAETPEADLFARLMAKPEGGTTADAAASLLTGDAGTTPAKAKAEGEADEEGALPVDLALPGQATDILPLIEAQAAAPVTARPGPASEAAVPDLPVSPQALGSAANPLPVATLATAAATGAPATIESQPAALRASAGAAPAAAIPASPAMRATTGDDSLPTRAVETAAASVPLAVEQALRAVTPAKTASVAAKDLPTTIASESGVPIAQLAASFLARPTARAAEKGLAKPAAEAAAAAAAPASSAQPQVAAFAPAVEPTLAATAATPTAVAGPAEPAVERQLDLARDGEWLDQLARDIAGAGERDGPMRFRLHPQTLGHLQVELSQSDLGTSVRLTADTEAARAILVDAQPRLMAEARAQGVRIAESHVDLAGSSERGTADSRRQDAERPNVIIRTAPAAAEEAEASDARRGESERYA